MSKPKFFTILHSDLSSAARRGILHLPHGDVSTPVFMPVGTRATVKAVGKDTLEEIGFEIILANTYHLYLRPGVETVEQAGGLHGFSGWRHNFLTDSGGFQVFSLSDLRKISPEGVSFRSHIDGSAHLFTPEKVAGLQARFNSDIQMQLDVCTAHGVGRDEAVRALEITGQWARRAKAAWEEKRDGGYRGLFFPITQGNFFKDLREQSAALVSALDTPGVAIGGLSVGEPPEVFAEMLAHSAPLLPREKPRYVMGIGTPDFILEAISNGIDMFDCVLPTRNARNGSYLTHDGPLSIKREEFARDFSPVDRECGCRVCRDYSRAYLRHLFKEQEILSAMLASYHNLYFLHHLVLEARGAIMENRFADFKTAFLRRIRG
ncbi:MAG: tRNA guanosine(34) transglycosylase Tgt [Spirochaetaceae bacterium]|jgi:queuine tRNA-ribosyltransferase|nr:tRNA guanosine(34) transglycosylase Tgt [Spirochaetaceae bacterium]